MKIEVDKIPVEGLELDELIDSHSLSLDLEMQGVVFPGTIEAKAKVKKTGSEVFVNLSLKAQVEYVCGRCLSKFESIFTKIFELNYETRPGDIIDLDEDIRQEIILDFPMKLLCKPDCKGLCPNCGQNLNIGECECAL